MRSSPESRCRRCTTGRARAAPITARFVRSGKPLREHDPRAWRRTRQPRPVRHVRSGGKRARVVSRTSPADGGRFILGGGWSIAVCAFTDGYAQPPTDRSAINGIRLVRYLHSRRPARARQGAAAARVHRLHGARSPCRTSCSTGTGASSTTTRRAQRQDRFARHDAGRLDRRAGELRCGIRRRADEGGAVPSRSVTPGRSSPWCYFPGSGVISMTSSVERRDRVGRASS